MTDRPILFSPSMVRALLDGRKTMTRRVINPQPHSAQSTASVDRAGGKWMSYEPSPETGGTRQMDPWRKLKYALGDRLYVREAWYAAYGADDIAPRDMNPTWKICPAVDWNYADWGIKGKFRQGIHMPRWASRLTLTITDVRVQLVRDTTEEDAQAEGTAAPCDVMDIMTYHARTTRRGMDGQRFMFAELWDSINAKPRPRYGNDKTITHYESFPWDGESRTETYRGKPHIITANPWVAAYSFTVAHHNIDAVQHG